MKPLLSVLVGLGDEDGVSVVVDMTCVVVKVLGHSQVVQKKDCSPLDSFQVNVVDVSVMKQLTVTLFGRCQALVLQPPLNVGDIVVLRGVQLNNRLGGRDATLGSFVSFDVVEDTDIETEIEKAGIDALISLPTMSVAGKERNMVEASLVQFHEAVEEMAFDEDLEYGLQAFNLALVCFAVCCFFSILLLC